ncbi:hypothetical protein NHQ30_006979 [Ciborinia camelliae]|nr:hypothetical protein NHQ30_006979 [Ciborinia camelliae]
MYIHSLNDLDDSFTAVNAVITSIRDWEHESKADSSGIYGQCLLSKYASSNKVIIPDATPSHLKDACISAENERSTSTSRYLALNDLGNAYYKKLKLDHSQPIEDLNKAF